MNNDLGYKDWRESVVNAERRLDTIEEKLDRVLDGLERIVKFVDQTTQSMVRSTTGNLRYIW